MSIDLYQAFVQGKSLKELYDLAIEKYEGEVKGFQIMLQRAELNSVESVKKQNVDSWRKEIKKAKRNLTQMKNLRKAME